MNKPEMIKEELNQYEWYSLGYESFTFTYIVKVRELRKSRAHLKAEIDWSRKVYRFIPCYKEKCNSLDIIAMFKHMNNFQKVATKYGYKFVQEEMSE